MIFGINYTAIIGKAPFIEWACFSAKTAKKFMPEVRTILYTNRPDLVMACQWGQSIDDIIVAPDYPQEDWHGAKIDGILASEKLGYDVTLHTDADTVFCADITDVFDLMGTGKFDLTVTQTRDQRKRTYPLRAIHPGFPWHQNCMLVFPWNDAVRKFFTDYRDFFNTHKVECREFRKPDHKIHPDMPAFNEALYHNSNLRLVLLPKNYNEQLWTGCLYGPAKVLHIHGMGGRKLWRTAKRLNEDTSGRPRLFRERQLL